MVLAQRAELATRATEIEQLKLMLAKLERMQLGRSSERLDRQVEQNEKGSGSRRGSGSKTRSRSASLPPFSRAASMAIGILALLAVADVPNLRPPHARGDRHLLGTA